MNVVKGKEEVRCGGVGSKPNGNVEVRSTIGWNVMEKKPRFTHLQFNIESAELKQFEKVCVGVVEKPIMTFNMQEAFHSEGYFGITATPLGANLVLLEEQVEGEIEVLMEEAKEWIRH